MSLQTRPLHPTLACEIEGLPLWEPLDPGTVAELRQLWSNWGVLVFRRQALSEAELAAFCALFGPLERTVRSDWASPRSPPLATKYFGSDIALCSFSRDAKSPAVEKTHRVARAVLWGFPLDMRRRPPDLIERNSLCA